MSTCSSSGGWVWLLLASWMDVDALRLRLFYWVGFSPGCDEES